MVGRDRYGQPITVALTLCLCITRQGFVVLALVFDRSLIYLGRAEGYVLVSWGFTPLILHTLNVFMEVPSFWLWKLKHLSVSCDWIDMFDRIYLLLHTSIQFLKSRLHISLSYLSQFAVILLPFDILFFLYLEKIGCAEFSPSTRPRAISAWKMGYMYIQRNTFP